MKIDKMTCETKYWLIEDWDLMDDKQREDLKTMHGIACGEREMKRLSREIKFGVVQGIIYGVLMLLFFIGLTITPALFIAFVLAVALFVFNVKRTMKDIHKHSIEFEIVENKKKDLGIE